MAYRIGPSTTITVEAGVSLANSLYCFGTIAADGQVDPTGAGLAADGVICGNTSVVGAAVPLATVVGEVVMVKSGAAIARGALVEADASGRAITRTAGVILGKAMVAAGAADEVIPVLLSLQR